MKLISKSGERRKITDKIFTVILVLVMAFTGYVMVMNAQGKAVSLFGNSILRVVTGSMEPTLLTGEYILVQKTDVSTLAEGDIITFYSEDPSTSGWLITHRIMEVTSDGTFITKGDANPVEDSVPVKPEKVLGKYVRKARFFAIVGSFADSRKLIMALVIIPILVLSFYETRTLAKLWKKYKGTDDGARAGANGESREDEIERIKREAVEEYLKQREKSNDEQGKEDEQSE